MLMYRKKLTRRGRTRVEMSPSLDAKVFDKCTCIGNDWEARQNFHNGENLQKGV